MTWTEKDTEILRAALPCGNLTTRAADEIERLRARVAELEAGQKQAASVLHTYGDELREHVYQELASALEAPPMPSVADAIPRDELVRALRARRLAYCRTADDLAAGGEHATADGYRYCAEALAALIDRLIDGTFPPKEGT